MKPEILKTEKAIAFVKDSFSAALEKHLNLVKVSSPIAVMDGTGINDDLNGFERAVSFPVKAMQERRAVVVHSLAKWKRVRLMQTGAACGEGIITDMRALRPDEDFTSIHSLYVDQWDWELRIEKHERTLSYLMSCVEKIYAVIRDTEQKLFEIYPELRPLLPEKISFISSQELLDMYPGFSAKERENLITGKLGAVFITGIGGVLSDGKPHDGRAADYDDWSLNGDILVWHPVLKRAFEISSMGIRVDREALKRQLEIRNCPEKSKLAYHSMLLAGELPECIGGGIGQSRLCMLLLRKSHIGEVQVGIWPDEIILEQKKLGVAIM